MRQSAATARGWGVVISLLRKNIFIAETAVVEEWVICTWGSGKIFFSMFSTPTCCLELGAPKIPDVPGMPPLIAALRQIHSFTYGIGMVGISVDADLLPQD